MARKRWVGVIIFEMLTGYPAFRGENAEEVFLSIMNFSGSVDWPEEDERISKAAKDCVSKFLLPAKKRLGYNGVEEIKKHPFFASINWNDIQKTKAPFIPELEDEYDTSCFPDGQNVKELILSEGSQLSFEGEDPFVEWDWTCAESN